MQKRCAWAPLSVKDMDVAMKKAARRPLGACSSGTSQMRGGPRRIQGMAVIFIQISQDLHCRRNSGRCRHKRRASVRDIRKDIFESHRESPIIRENTKDNTPAIVHYSIVKSVTK